MSLLPRLANQPRTTSVAPLDSKTPTPSNVFLPVVTSDCTNIPGRKFIIGDGTAI